MSFAAPGPGAIRFLRNADLVVGVAALGFAALGVVTTGFASFLALDGGGFSADDWRAVGTGLGVPFLMFTVLGITGLAAARALRHDTRHARRVGLVAAAGQVVLCAAFLPLAILGISGMWILWQAPLAMGRGEQSG